MTEGFRGSSLATSYGWSDDRSKRLWTSRYKRWQTAWNSPERSCGARFERRFKIVVDVDRFPSPGAIAATRDSTPLLLVVTPADDRCIRLRYGRPRNEPARQPSDVGPIGLSALRTPGGLVGTTAPGWNSGMPGSQSSCAACTSASTLAEESSRLALPVQPQVQCAWLLRRSRTTTTTPRPPVESPIVARSPPSVVLAARVALQSHSHHYLTVVSVGKLSSV